MPVVLGIPQTPGIMVVHIPLPWVSVVPVPVTLNNVAIQHVGVDQVAMAVGHHSTFVETRAITVMVAVDTVVITMVTSMTVVLMNGVAVLGVVEVAQDVVCGRVGVLHLDNFLLPLVSTLRKKVLLPVPNYKDLVNRKTRR